jgi:hypothetical protein
MKVHGGVATCARRQDGGRMSGECSSEVLWWRRRPTHRRGGRRRGFGSDCSGDCREKVARRLAPAQRQATPACGGGRVSGGRRRGTAYWRGAEARQLRNGDGGFGPGIFIRANSCRTPPPSSANQDEVRPDTGNDRWGPCISKNSVLNKLRNLFSTREK